MHEAGKSTAPDSMSSGENRAVLAGPVHYANNAPVRGTQSFVAVMEEVWKHPSWSGIEIAWRWLYGCVAMFALYRVGLQVFSVATGGQNSLEAIGLAHLVTTDPLEMAAQFAAAASLLLPAAEQAAKLWVPVLLLGWVAAATVGRVLLLRRVDRALQPKIVTLFLLQAIRIAALAGSCIAWFLLVQWAGRVAVTDRLAEGREPNLVTYCGLAVGATLILFLVWAVVSWLFSLAPLLSVVHQTGVGKSLHLAAQRGPVSSKLIEINLVMGIVKVALVVLAMVFSASPLPFQNVATAEFLNCWWLGVSVLYLIASDYFHVVRLIAYLRLWQRFHADAEYSSPA